MVHWTIGFTNHTSWLSPQFYLQLVYKAHQNMLNLNVSIGNVTILFHLILVLVPMSGLLLGPLIECYSNDPFKNALFVNLACLFTDYQ